MPDYAACTDESCPLRKTCYRYMMVIDNPDWQSYFMESPREGDKCEWHMAIGTRRVREDDDA